MMEGRVEIDLKLPASWADLSPEEVRYAGWLYSRRLARERMLAMAFLRFTGLAVSSGVCFAFRRQRRLGDLRPEVFVIEPDVFWGCCEKLSFLTDVIGAMAAPGFAGAVSPDSRLFNVSLDDYFSADFYYQSIGVDNRLEQARLMAGKLWRPKGSGWFAKRRFKRMVRRMSSGDATADYVWYTGVKGWLRDEYPLIFSPSDGDRVSPRETVLGLLSVFNEGRPQDNERILRTSMHEVFFELNRKVGLRSKVKG
jgi:hypothetical protein